MSINERIKCLRKELKMNQTDFGNRIAIAQGYLTNIETGRREPTEKIIKLISMEFNVNEEWLRSGNGEMFIEQSSVSLDEYAKSKNLSSLDLDIIRAYMDLDKDTRTKILNNLNNILIKHNSDIVATLDKPSSSNDDIDIELELSRYRMELEAGRTLSASGESKHA